MFDNILEDMDQSREVVQNLVEEYTAATKPDYLTWGMQQDGKKGWVSSQQIEILIPLHQSCKETTTLNCTS